MVKHILKDGTVLSDISDHIVRAEDASEAYALMDRINEQEGEQDD